MQIQVDAMNFLGHILIRTLPDITKEEFLEWWPRLTGKERDRYTVHEANNLITFSGRSQILTYIGNANANTPAFSQWFAVGNVGINYPSPGDSSIAGEILRLQPTTNQVTGNTVDLSTFFNSSQASNQTLTNCGLFGVNATSTPGSGTLMTHATLGQNVGIGINGYFKPSGQSLTIDYIIALS